MSDPEVKIDKNIPIDSITRQARYPWRTMQVGDSFYSETPIYGIASATGKRLGKKFTVRKEGPGFRCWRSA